MTFAQVVSDHFWALWWLFLLTGGFRLVTIAIVKATS